MVASNLYCNDKQISQVVGNGRGVGLLLRDLWPGFDELALFQKLVVISVNCRQF